MPNHLLDVTVLDSYSPPRSLRCIGFSACCSSSSRISKGPSSAAPASSGASVWLASRSTPLYSLWAHPFSIIPTTTVTCSSQAVCPDDLGCRREWWTHSDTGGLGKHTNTCWTLCKLRAWGSSVSTWDHLHSFRWYLLCKEGFSEVVMREKKKKRQELIKTTVATRNGVQSDSKHGETVWWSNRHTRIPLVSVSVGVLQKTEPKEL